MTAASAVDQLRLGLRGSDEPEGLLAHLAVALEAHQPELFLDYAGWLDEVRRSRGLQSELQELKGLLRRRLAPELASEALSWVERAQAAERPAPAATTQEPLTPEARAYLDLLLAGQRQAALQHVLQLSQAGASLHFLYFEVFAASQREVGRLWQNNAISVAQEHFCTAATQLIMGALYPRVFGTARCGLRLVATCVAGDLHELGPRMLSDIFEAAGWDTYFLGANTPTQDVVAALLDQRADCLAVGVTLTRHLPAVRQLIEAVRATPGLQRLPVLVGGAPLDRHPELWRSLGAQGSVSDPREAEALARRLVSGA